MYKEKARLAWRRGFVLRALGLGPGTRVSVKVTYP